MSFQSMKEKIQMFSLSLITILIYITYNGRKYTTFFFVIFGSH
jgi:hypothetical protein